MTLVAVMADAMDDDGFELPAEDEGPSAAQIMGLKVSCQTHAWQILAR